MRHPVLRFALRMIQCMICSLAGFNIKCFWLSIVFLDLPGLWFSAGTARRILVGNSQHKGEAFASKSSGVYAGVPCCPAFDRIVLSKSISLLWRFSPAFLEHLNAWQHLLILYADIHLYIYAEVSLGIVDSSEANKQSKHHKISWLPSLNFFWCWRYSEIFMITILLTYSNFDKAQLGISSLF